MWPLDTGVLVERVVQEDSGYDGLPTLFSLLQPMDEFSPVSCRRPTASECPNKDVHALIRNKDVHALIRNEDVHALIRNKDVYALIRNNAMHALIRNKDMHVGTPFQN